MENWKSTLKADPTEWLLEKDNPSVRYFSLIHLLDKAENSPEVLQAQEDLANIGVVPEIIAKQHPEGYWETPDSFYTDKYKGTVWQLIILAELGAKGDPIQKAGEFILTHSQDLESGGFSIHSSAKLGGGRHSEVIPCLTGNMVWSLIRSGFLDDPRVQHGIGWIVRYQRFDDGIMNKPQGWPWEKYEDCWGKHTCHMGAVKALKALAEIPASRRSREVRDKIKQGAEYLFIHHIHKKSHDLSQISKPSWLRLGFPMMYQTDVLEILEILTKLGYKDPRMQEALDAVIAKQDSEGQWRLENTFNGRYQANIEQKGNPSKWITLKALTVLKRFYE